MDLMGTELVDMLKRRDPKAISELYDNYAPALYGVILRIVKSHACADLILEQTFLKVLSDIHMFDKNTSVFAWMLRIARTSALKNSFEDIDADEKVVSDAEHSVSTKNCQALIEGMELQCGEVIKHLYLEGHTILQTSQALNIPLEKVKTQLRSAFVHIHGKLIIDTKIVFIVPLILSLLVQIQSK